MARRLPWIDAARGGALLAMAGYHLTWDLAEFRWIDSTIIASRPFHFIGHAIAASFLLLSGFSLALARQARAVPLWRDPRYWRRWAQIAAAAGAISAASLWLFPQAPIFFGILHCIALASLIALPFVEARVVVTLAAAALAFAAPALFASPFFNAWPWWGTGLATLSPSSNDYRPLLPWLAFMLAGVALAHLSLRADPKPRPDAAFTRPLAFLGRHSLAFYLVHQPVLYGALALIGPAAPATDEAAFASQCVAQCLSSGVSMTSCEKSCACVASRAKTAGRWTALLTGALTEAQKSATHVDAVECYAEAIE